jgi:predicted NBD/HSP70 family sugar kinase
MKYNTAVFDIGGTWFRSGVYSKISGLAYLSKAPAFNYKNTPYNKVIELQLKLVDYLVQQVQSFQNKDIGIHGASISMGAALNGRTGEILNSGPLWGPECEPFDLLGQLQKQMPEVDWLVINDVSAALLRHIKDPEYKGAKRVNLITISSGIACRTYDQKGRYVPLNEDGIQGEIGHIPIHFSLFGETITENCDCGGINHLNAFVSGRGIAKILRRLLASEKSPIKDSRLYSQLHELEEAGLNKAFFDMLNKGDPEAIKVLDQVTFPIAEMIINTLTIDAEIEKIIMTGGVVHASEEHYMKSLLTNLEKIGLYQNSDPTTFFKKTVKLGVNDDNSGLLGAAIAFEDRK